MTDDELNRMVHVHIFGWKLDELPVSLHMLYPPYPWPYCSDIRLAWEVQERIADLGLQLRYANLLVDVSDLNSDSALIALVYASPRQRVLAALAVVGAKVEP